MPAPNIPAAKRAGLIVDIERMATDGDAWLTPEDRYALKTYGVCTQLQDGVFMIRVRVPGGRMTPAQARGLADIAETYAHSWIHLTTRQQVELHWVKAHDVPAVLRAVEASGLTNRSACGHTMRNVMSCPDAGVDLEEPFDCYRDAVAVSDAILTRSAELNCVLPSRINIAFGGCGRCREHARLNDAGFVSTIRDGELGYEVWAAGSLGTMPFLGLPLLDFVPRERVVAAALALVDVFVAHGDLDNPRKGRMKFVVEAMGAEAFRHAFASAYARHDEATPVTAVGGPLEAAEMAEILRHVPPGGWGEGVRPQRTPGLAMVTVNVPLGDLVSDDLRTVASLTHYSDGVLHLTRNQNLMLRNVPIGGLRRLRPALAVRNLSLAGADAAVDVRACVGSAVCSLAITAAPDAGQRLLASPALARNSSLRVHVSGCPNSCAQHQAADIGLHGAKVRVHGATRLGYYVWVGADVAAGSLATQVGRVAEEDVVGAVDAIIGVWEVLRRRGETLAATFGRVGADAFSAQVASVAEGFEPGLDEPDIDLTHAPSVPLAVSAG